MTDYVLYVTVILLIWISLAQSQGLLTGYLGILAVHQAAAWAIGAYTAALLNRLVGLPLGLTALPGAIAAGLLVTGATWLVARGRRDDQVIASLCIQIIFVALLVNLTPITGGPNGIANIGWGGPDDQRTRTLACLGVAACLATASTAAFFMLSHGRKTAHWRLIRDDAAYAASLGLDVGRARLECAFLAAAIAGAAGTVYAHYVTFIDPQSFGLAEAVAILSIAIVGRAPSLGGILIASVLLVLAPEALRWLDIGATHFANFRQLIFGTVLVGAIAFRRQ